MIFVSVWGHTRFPLILMIEMMRMMSASEHRYSRLAMPPLPLKMPSGEASVRHAIKFLFDIDFHVIVWYLPRLDWKSCFSRSGCDDFRSLPRHTITTLSSYDTHFSHPPAWFYLSRLLPPSPARFSNDASPTGDDIGFDTYYDILWYHFFFISFHIYF